MYRTKAAAAAADMETAADRHSHWPDFAYQCKAIVVLLLLLLLWLLLLLLLLLGKLICSQLASLLLHAIWNLQSATQSLLNNGKMKLLENDCQTEAARAVAGHSACQLVAATHCTYTYIFIYVSKHPNKIFGILGLFFTAALLCLDLLRFLAASFPSCPPMWHAARVDNQASAYKTQCLQLSWHAKRLASHVELCDWRYDHLRLGERILSYRLN